MRNFLKGKNIWILTVAFAGCLALVPFEKANAISALGQPHGCYAIVSPLPICTCSLPIYMSIEFCPPGESASTISGSYLGFPGVTNYKLNFSHVSTSWNTGHNRFVAQCLFVTPFGCPTIPNLGTLSPEGQGNPIGGFGTSLPGQLI